MKKAKRKKETERTMKKIKLVLISITVIIIALFIFLFMVVRKNKNVTFEIVNYDVEVLERANEYTKYTEFAKKEENPFKDTNRYFNVNRTSVNEFSVDVNGTEMIIRIPESQNKEYEPENKKSINNDLIRQSKEKINSYIEKSKILKDKKDIMKYIESIEVKNATFSDDVTTGAYFSYKDNTLYINKENEQYICEWMIIHEYIHAISYFTHNCDINNERYAFNLFNEVMTDLIASTLEPGLSDGIISGYSDYYSIVYPYISLFGEEVINAYFYGYENIFEKTSEEEFDFFVIVIENMGKENSDIYYNNLIYKWYSKNN